MSRPLNMRYAVIVPEGASQVAIGPFNTFKAAEGIAGGYEGGFVIPMLRCSRHGEVEQRDDFAFTAAPPRSWGRCD